MLHVREKQTTGVVVAFRTLEVLGTVNTTWEMVGVRREVGFLQETKD